MNPTNTQIDLTSTDVLKYRTEHGLAQIKESARLVERRLDRYKASLSQAMPGGSLARSALEDTAAHQQKVEAAATAMRESFGKARQQMGIGAADITETMALRLPGAAAIRDGEAALLDAHAAFTAYHQAVTGTLNAALAGQPSSVVPQPKGVR